jgi:hypothetical protein
MSAASKWTLVGGIAALTLVLLFPAWRQTYRGHPLSYNEEMGHHFLLRPPQPTGEQSWILKAPASECKVEVKKDVLLSHAATVLAMTAVLLLSFARFAKEGPLAESLTTRRLAIVSSLLALCLPFPPPDGEPTVLLVVMAPISPFMDNGHVGPWAVPMFAGLSFGMYFLPVFALASGLVWLARRRISATEAGV